MGNTPMKKLLLLVAITATLSGCASKDILIITKEDGSLETRALANTQSASESIARDNAKTECKKYKHEPVILSMDTQYQGAFEEKTNKAVKTVTSIASITGILSGHSGDSNDYETTLTFKCE